MVKQNMTHRDYYLRHNWVRMRMQDNAKNPNLSDKQHAAIAILADYRHRMHCGREEFFDAASEEGMKYRSFLLYTMPVMLSQAGLPPLDVSSELFTMPDSTLAKEFGLKGQYLELAKSTSRMAAERINNEIEGSLRLIDSTYGTWYAPKGTTRDRDKEKAAMFHYEG